MLYIAFMAKVPVGLRLEPGMIEAVDAARGDVPRVRWIERAIERALAPHAVAVAVPGVRIATSREVKAGVKPIPRTGGGR